MTASRVAATLLLIGVSATAQSQVNPQHDLAVGVRFSAERAQTVAGSCCFYLTGGAADVALPVLPRISAVVELAGGTTQQVAGTTRGLSVITLFAGPRYTIPLHRRFAVSAQALFGAARGFDADFSYATHAQDTATAFGMALGGFADYRLTRSLHIRPAQVDYLQTNLPNGSDNRQRNIRLGAGITVELALPRSRR